MREPIQFGDYYLFERVAVGGMAEVFKGVSYGVEGFERLFAVKRVLPNIAEDQEFIEMFIDEAKIAVQLSHANIGQIFELGKVDGSYFIAMEFVQGRDLRTIWDRARQADVPLKPAMCCHMIKEVCEALEYAHNKKRNTGEDLDLIHRDVSPQNIIVSYDGEVKLIDFGIAKAAGKASKTQAGILKGKFGYMSPEQVRGRVIDRRTDLFSLAAVLFEMLTLERCFQGESDFSTLEKVRNVDIRRPSELNGEIPPELERIILKGLAREPDDRYQTAAEFQDALQKFLYQSGTFYARKDLSGFMRRTFASELRGSQQRLSAFREYARQNIREARRATSGLHDEGESTVDEPAFQPDLSGLSWEDEELETAVWDRSPSQILAEVDLSRERHRPAPSPILAAEPAFLRDAATLQETPEARMRAMNLPSAPTLQTHVQPEPQSRWRVWALFFVALLAIGFAAFVVYNQRKGGTVTFDTMPAAVLVAIDGAPAQPMQSPVRLPDLAAGAHRVRITAPGFQPAEHQFTLSAGQERALGAVQLAATPTGLHIETQPGGAKVYIDDTYVDDTPLRASKVTPGIRRLRIELVGYLPWNGTVEAAEGAMRRVEAITLVPAEANVRFIAEPDEPTLTLVSPNGKREPLGKGTIKRAIPNLGGYTVSAELEGHTTVSQIIPQFPIRDANNVVSLTLKPIVGRVVPSQPSKPVVNSRARRRPRVDEDAPAPRRAAVATQPARRRPARRPATRAPRVVIASKPPVRRRRRPVKPKGFGFLKLLAKPPAQAFIGGRSVGWTPLLAHKLPAGSHTVELVREGVGAYRRSITVLIEDEQTTFRKFTP